MLPQKLLMDKLHRASLQSKAFLVRHILTKVNTIVDILMNEKGLCSSEVHAAVL